jgi:hypothetical protein
MSFVGDFNPIDGAAINSTCGLWTSQARTLQAGGMRGVSEEVKLVI